MILSTAEDEQRFKAEQEVLGYASSEEVIVLSST